ncbi:hypothetical protein EDB81DRAFT_898082 [Dactylonectria macrodidyma]|uniref:DNA polymerase eta n=1 Tax=Dactylonectria macrodidyma TaxID=307937 RepID=A0A9P9JRW0_9HYPO|nr:hypothetical protein EDB81DRAFT_898082 [Dactylonectria macrodidyma]
MPSSPPLHGHRASSPLHGGGIRRSQFTYRQLSQLASSSTSNPLRVVAHVDLDGFYAQCEMVRLGIPKDKPLAVQQWQALIAVNYPAREWGIGRHCSISEAKKLCPDLIAPHVATWREGDDKWAYRDDADTNIATDKVSLDPYRLESRKILALIKDFLPTDLQRVEKAGIDEVFLDLSSQVHSILLERYPELKNPPPYDDPTERLPLPPISALDWQADALIDLDEEQETIDPDWDDVAILIGSEIVRDVRAKVWSELSYTCSAGIASNKLLSKLGSAFKKPNQQTVVRNRAVNSFMSGFKVTKLRNLGGKLGDQVVTTFETENVKDLFEVALDTMKAKLGSDIGLWVYNTIRGIDNSEVSSRTQIKSMLSAKSFRPTISTQDQAVRWLRIFVADIYARLVEEGVLENKRRPRTMNLHHRHGGQMRSRQGPIPQGKSLDEQTLLELAKDLLAQIISDGKVWPCTNLSLSVGGFEDGVKGNMGIDGFLVKGEEAEALRSGMGDTRPAVTHIDRPVKKRRVEDGGIQRFFAKVPADGSPDNAPPPTAGGETDLPSRPLDIPNLDLSVGQPSTSGFSTAQAEHGVSCADLLACSRCMASFIDPDALQSHEDWHLAKDIQDAERVKPTFAERPPTPRISSKKGQGASSKRGRGGKLEPGQSRLRFG